MRSVCARRRGRWRAAAVVVRRVGSLVGARGDGEVKQRDVLVAEDGHDLMIRDGGQRDEGACSRDEGARAGSAARGGGA